VKYPCFVVASSLTEPDVLFFDSDGDQAISSFDEVDFLEPDSAGTPGLSWGVIFVEMEGDTLPGASGMQRPSRTCIWPVRGPGRVMGMAP
jgi:hypothetical protein